jgi:hypothetical protein
MHIYGRWFPVNGDPTRGVYPRKCNFCYSTWKSIKPDDMWAHACTKCDNTKKVAGFRELRLETCAIREEMVGSLRTHVYGDLSGEAGASSGSAKRLRGSSEPPSGTQSLLRFGFGSHPKVAQDEQERMDRLLVRFVAHGALPMRLVDHLPFREFCAALRPDYGVPTKRTFSALINKVSLSAKKAVQRLTEEEPIGSTLTADAWSTKRMESVVSVNLVLGSSRQAVLYSTDEMSGESHTGDHISKFFMDTIIAIETRRSATGELLREHRILMINTDHAANMRSAREKTVATPGFQHILQSRWGRVQACVRACVHVCERAHVSAFVCACVRACERA